MGNPARLGLIPAHAGKTPLPFRLRSRGRAHPRSRGENSLHAPICCAKFGSSPLTRGKRHPRIRLGLPAGLIPTHAGKTKLPRSESCRTSAHPRSRGENLGTAWIDVVPSGSSPLTRGKHRDLRRIEREAGLIPTHAGKTFRRAGRCSSHRAHPHSCGENFGLRGRGPRNGGSSPLMRGKLAAEGLDRRAARLIPAHAGKTGAVRWSRFRCRAHPRSRGENIDLWAQIYLLDGSSPLARGKLPGVRIPERRLRLIPAHAGKTSGGPPRSRRSPAHPRSRGENDICLSMGTEGRGSSPLTRGKPLRILRLPGLVRLIPAHAGKTERAESTAATSRAHPHSRGENPATPGSSLGSRGSSPLTRGKQQQGRKGRRCVRLIPTHAGKTRRHTPPSRTTEAHPHSRGENSPR